jgi:acyl-CoA reductase-like NAD-dependent aldehyde dehydrogenase
MKFFVLFKNILLAIMLLTLASCSSSSNVADGGLIQKRKYRSGFHLNLANHKKQRVEKAIEPASQEFEIERIAKVGTPVTERISVFHTINDHLNSQGRKYFEPSVELVLQNHMQPREGELENLEQAKLYSAPDMQSAKTLTGSYQKKGKIALLHAFLVGVFAVLAAFLFTISFPVLGFLSAVAAFTAFLITLILAFSSTKYSKAARWSFFVLFLSAAAAGALIFLVIL